MSGQDDALIFTWIALVALCALGIGSWILVEAAYLFARIWRSYLSWWRYGRHGAAYKRSVIALKRRYDRMQEAASRFGRLRVTFGGTDERR